jgi:molecular chaperone GrpE
MDETKLEEETKPEAVQNQARDSAQATPEASGGDTATPTPDLAAQIAELESALAQERARADKLTDQSQRMAAEFQNSRRRLEGQVQDEIERASTHLIRKLLPVIDDLDLAFANAPAGVESGAPWVEGFRQIQKKLHNLLAEEGVEIIAQEGAFDPALHEAVSGEASDSVPEGHIIGTLRSGYTYKGKVLRPALVRVAM